MTGKAAGVVSVLTQCAIEALEDRLTQVSEQCTLTGAHHDFYRHPRM